ncbi:MAG: helix-turn-helix transcriptional regulator [Rivularia sp. (in: cyanobacteria)]
MINKFFKQAQDKYGVQGKELAKLAGIGTTHLSDFRNGKKWVSQEVLVKLLEAMDELAPGSRIYFCQLLASEPISFEKQALAERLVDLIDQASDEDMEIAMIAMGRKWKRGRSSSGGNHDRECDDLETARRKRDASCIAAI